MTARRWPKIDCSNFNGNAARCVPKGGTQRPLHKPISTLEIECAEFGRTTARCIPRKMPNTAAAAKPNCNRQSFRNSWLPTFLALHFGVGLNTSSRSFWEMRSTIFLSYHTCRRCCGTKDFSWTGAAWLILLSASEFTDSFAWARKCGSPEVANTLQSIHLPSCRPPRDYERCIRGMSKCRLCNVMRRARISARRCAVGQLSDSGKVTSAGAHQRPQGPSMFREPAERLDAGKNGIHDPSSGALNSGVSRPTTNTMGMSVALEGEARQAAAAKLAEEQALVRKAQAGDRLAFEELVRRFDREVSAAGVESGASSRRCAGHLPGKFSARL